MQKMGLRRKCILPLLFFLTSIALVGCGRQEEQKITNISVFQGDEQYAFPNEDFPKELYIRVDGKGEIPLQNKALKIEVSHDSDLAVSSNRIVTDAGGLARVKVAAGKKTGDGYVIVTPEEAPDKAIRARFITGVKIIGGNQEGAAGTELENPLGVKLVDSEGNPLSGVPVYITPVGGIVKVSVSENDLVTDEKGEAYTGVKLSDQTGAGLIDIEVASSKMDNMIRTIRTRAMSIDFYAIAINVFGGLAIFIFGMKLMSDGLTMIAGERMRNILHFCAQNRVVATMAGTAVTATIQSSSGTTVMVIGFVNAGLLTLSQSIGIIFGANIGTTITAQIVAFNVSALAMPAIIVGLLITFITWHRFRGWGETILGFGLLFFGMTLMSSDLKSISEFESFTALFKQFDCAPIDGTIPVLKLLGAIGIGVVVTMILQSSSAVSGVVIALGAGGLVNLYTAVALILGSNIGTTITAQLAAIPANKVAKQTALAHTLFNVVGVLLITGTFWINWPGTNIPFFFYLVNISTNGNAFAEIPQNMPRHIANAHTLFNVVTTLVLLPFVDTFASICSRLIPIGTKKIKYQYLEPLLLDTPSLALEQTVFALRKMLAKSWKIVDRAVNEHFIPVDVDEKKVNALSKREKRVDRYQFEIQEYLSLIMRRDLTPEQTNMIPPLMHCTNDAERIADRGGNMIQLTRRMKEQEVKLSDEGEHALNEIFEALKKQALETLIVLKEPDKLKIREITEMEKKVGDLATAFEAAHIVRLNSGKCEVVTGIIFVELLAELFAISRHLSNIAERAATLKGAPYSALPKRVVPRPASDVSVS